jgi:hypothetical protein
MGRFGLFWQLQAERRREEDVPDDLKEDFWEHCAMKKGNYLQAPAVRPIARYSLAWGSWFPRSLNARDLGHPAVRSLGTATPWGARIRFPAEMSYNAYMSDDVRNLP